MCTSGSRMGGRHMTLQDDLKEAEARVAMLKARISSADCAEVGHMWMHIGGVNAGCGDDCQCSVPIYECARCGDSDYGDNEEADEVREDCSS